MQKVRDTEGLNESSTTKVLTDHMGALMSINDEIENCVAAVEQTKIILHTNMKLLKA